MMKRSLYLFGIFLSVFAWGQQQNTPVQIAVGGRGGLSIFSSGQSSAGLQLGPTFDVDFGKGLLAGSDLTLNTQDGTPIEWAFYGKYLIQVPASNILPYVDG